MLWAPLNQTKGLFFYGRVHSLSILSVVSGGKMRLQSTAILAKLAAVKCTILFVLDTNKRNQGIGISNVKANVWNIGDSDRSAPHDRSLRCFWDQSIVNDQPTD